MDHGPMCMEINAHIRTEQGKLTVKVSELLKISETMQNLQLMVIRNTNCIMHGQNASFLS